MAQYKGILETLGKELGGLWSGHHNNEPMPNDGKLHTGFDGLEHFEAKFSTKYATHVIAALASNGITAFGISNTDGKVTVTLAPEEAQKVLTLRHRRGHSEKTIKEVLDKHPDIPRSRNL